MIDALIKIAIGIGVYLFADAVTEEVTGKHIHEHVCQWWQELSATIQEWLHVHKDQLGVTQIMIEALALGDKAAGRIKHLTDHVAIKVYGLNSMGQKVAKITESEVSHEDAIKEFPELAEKPELIMEV